MTSYFADIEPIRFEGPESSNPLAFKYYDKTRMVMGKTMDDHLRLAVCYWHTFCWDGFDVFGAGTFNRPWHGGPVDQARADHKLDEAFAFFTRLGLPYFCFHDVDVMATASTIDEHVRNFATIIDKIEAKMAQTGVKLLWGGREGYDTILNTDLAQEKSQLGRFLNLVVEHKHKIGFTGTILIEPKPHEPTKHQYDFDVETVFAFLQKHGLENEVKVNIEANHATLAGHSFEHEIATAVSLGILGSIDMNRGDPQNGWDTDQFPNDVREITMAMYYILKNGGLGTGGNNFDAKVRRQSIDAADLFHGHVGSVDVLARGLLGAAKLIEGGQLDGVIAERYAGWQTPDAQAMLSGSIGLAEIADKALADGVAPQPRSGRQEMLENIISNAC